MSRTASELPARDLKPKAADTPAKAANEEVRESYRELDRDWNQNC